MSRSEFDDAALRDPLVLPVILERARDLYPTVEVVTYGDGNRPTISTYAETNRRVEQTAAALTSLGVSRGDRVATFCWNSSRHLELFLAIGCMGAVLHPVNIRLAEDQILWTMHHAEDCAIFVDRALLTRFRSVYKRLDRKPETVIVIDGRRAHPEQVDLESLDVEISDDTFLATGSTHFGWPELDELSGCILVYTSGTTGRPRGVVYTHRSVLLYTFMLNQGGVYALTESDTVLSIVPMYHANAWGLPYAAVLAGARQVFLGSAGADPSTILEAIEEEGVTVAIGVPTVWLGMLEELERRPRDISTLRQAVTGGSQPTRSLLASYQRHHGIRLVQGWGMTETGPLGTFSSRPASDRLDDDADLVMRLHQGRPVPGVRIRVCDLDSGAELPWDGSSVGEVQIRAPWVASRYIGDPVATAEHFTNGWLRTGDIGFLHPDGSLQLVDRTKDVIKSGGEWISSLSLESALSQHPLVNEVAVVARQDDRWGERPVAYIVLRDVDDREVTREELTASLSRIFPKWWLPDQIYLVPELPRTSVGKIDKEQLRHHVDTS